jgi:integrating conjugative element protein (TIGR03757 family)
MKKSLKVASVFLAMFCNVCLANQHSLKIFVTDSSPVIFPPKEEISIGFRVFNLDELERSENKLTLEVRKRITSNITPGTAQKAYEAAFSELLNSPDWKPIYRSLQRSTEPQEMAMRLGITKVPAIVLDDKYIIYGVADYLAALDLFVERGYINND